MLQTSHSSSTAFLGPAGRPQSVQGKPAQMASSGGDAQPQPQTVSALIPSSKGARTDQAVLWTHVRKPSANAYLMNLWTNLLQAFASLSTVFEEVKHHQHWKQATGVILDSFAASTLKKYLTCLTKFRQTCAEMRINLAEISAIHILDILLMRSKDSGMHGSMLLKSLRWFRIQAGISSLSCLDHPLLVAWSRTKNQSDRRESLPLPLYVLVQWERRILQASASSMEKIFLGSMLLQAWAGLRYADLQRISFETLVITPEEVRGICWKTKTTHRGQPWGAIASGFLSEGSSNWLLVFLKTWDEWFSAMDDVTSVDFIIPMMSDKGFDVPLQIMSYPRALLLFRHYLKLPWKSSSPLDKLNPANYTLHGIKATLLSWSSQLRHQGMVSMEMCRLQGHHKPIQQSVSLYSRDDVLGQLELQKRLVSETHRGFRPITPHTGGARHLQ